MTTQSKSANPVKHSPSTEDVKAMGLYERLWHVQTEARAAKATSKSYNGTYADRVAIWNDLLQALFAKYRLLIVSTLSEYKTTDISGNPDTAPLYICSLHRAEDDEDHRSPVRMRFHLKNGSEQDIGKQMTYFDRYALKFMSGVSVDKDPDDPGAQLTVRANTPRPTVDPRILAGAQDNTTTNSLDEFE